MNLHDGALYGISTCYLVECNIPYREIVFTKRETLDIFKYDSINI